MERFSAENSVFPISMERFSAKNSVFPISMERFSAKNSVFPISRETDHPLADRFLFNPVQTKPRTLSQRMCVGERVDEENGTV